MEQFITHACGHAQAHYLSGFASQQERKARWLQTTKCRTCFIAERQADQATAAVRDGAAIAHLELAQLSGSERQVAWATTIRTGRLATMVTDGPAEDQAALPACLAIADAKWWIDHRALSDTDLIAKANLCAGTACSAGEENRATGVAQAA
ncbi:MAG TPA: hypothetical protein VF637_04295 [Sphingomicrobium sp.]|jgi:hypothetical protein